MPEVSERRIRAIEERVDILERVLAQHQRETHPRDGTRRAAEGRTRHDAGARRRQAGTRRQNAAAAR